MNFVNKTEKKVKKDFFDGLTKEVFSYSGKKISYDFDLILVSKNEIKKLNYKYRKIDRVTDVLSFELKDGLFLGQIVLCLEKVKEQAKENERNEDKELAEVFVHGLLHLLGFKDDTERGRKKMEEIQKQII